MALSIGSQSTILYGSGNSAITTTQIKDYVATHTPEEIQQAAVENGVSLSQIGSAIGADSAWYQSANQYLAQQGITSAGPTGGTTGPTGGTTGPTGGTTGPTGGTTGPTGGTTGPTGGTTGPTGGTTGPTGGTTGPTGGTTGPTGGTTGPTGGTTGPTGGATGVNPYQSSMDSMTQNAAQQAQFQMAVQMFSAQTTAGGTTTKLITDSHQEARNSLANVSSARVNSSRG